MSHLTAVEQAISKYKIFAIIRGIASEQMIPTVQSLIDGGIRLLEVTFDHEGDLTNTLESVRKIRAHFADQVICGVGTTTTELQVYEAARAGAQFVVSPNTDNEIIRLTKMMGMTSIPGAYTPTEIIAARKAGADFIKLFPCGLTGAGYVKALTDVLSTVPMIVVGGVSADNARQFLEAGAVGVGVGSFLVNATLTRSSNYQEITERCQTIVASLTP
jgi:2-dehydro-3-deoxyphosphogluconate aldolase/(4S)-4-hydroxy-2-oxoglutarate aldolase